MAGVEAIMTWTFASECAVPADVQNILVDGEQAVVAYKTIRDVAVITNNVLLLPIGRG